MKRYLAAILLFPIGLLAIGVTIYAQGAKLLRLGLGQNILPASTQPNLALFRWRVIMRYRPLLLSLFLPIVGFGQTPRLQTNQKRGLRQ